MLLQDSLTTEEWKTEQQLCNAVSVNSSKTSHIHDWDRSNTQDILREEDGLRTIYEMASLILAQDKRWRRA